MIQCPFCLDRQHKRVLSKVPPNKSLWFHKNHSQRYCIFLLWIKDNAVLSCYVICMCVCFKASLHDNNCIAFYEFCGLYLMTIWVVIWWVSNVMLNCLQMLYSSPVFANSPELQQQLPSTVPYFAQQVCGAISPNYCHSAIKLTWELIGLADCVFLMAYVNDC